MLGGVYKRQIRSIYCKTVGTDFFIRKIILAALEGTLVQNMHGYSSNPNMITIFVKNISISYNVFNDLV